MTLAAEDTDITSVSTRRRHGRVIANRIYIGGHVNAARRAIHDKGDEGYDLACSTESRQREREYTHSKRSPRKANNVTRLSLELQAAWSRLGALHRLNYHHAMTAATIRVLDRLGKEGYLSSWKSHLNHLITFESLYSVAASS